MKQPQLCDLALGSRACARARCRPGTLSLRKNAAPAPRSQREHQRLFFCAVFVLAVAALMLVGGCKSASTSTPTATNTAVNPTLGQTQTKVNQSMTSYRNALAQGGVTVAQQMQVDKAYQNFQQAFVAAVQAAGNNYQAATPQNVKALANQVSGAISQSPFSDTMNLNNQ